MIAFEPIPMSRRVEWLTERERTVLLHLMHGLSAEQIATVDYVSVSTIRSQIRSLLQKLGVRSCLAAVAQAYAYLWPIEERDAAFDRLLVS